MLFSWNPTSIPDELYGCNSAGKKFGRRLLYAVQLLHYNIMFSVVQHVFILLSAGFAFC